MIDFRTSTFSSTNSVQGNGLINSLINKLPFELHLPSYNFCGPGTKLEKRLARGDRGINQLDEACREHDIAYSKSNNLNYRHSADKILSEKSWQRFKAKDSTLSEKLNSLLVTNMMKAKSTLGMGISSKTKTKKDRRQCPRKKKINFFKNAVKEAKVAIKNSKTENINKLASTALTAARQVIKNKRRNITLPRVIPIPKVRGFLPLLPILAGLSAVGSLTGGVAGMAKAINDSKIGRKQLEENKRHNKVMETIKLKQGKGLYLKPYKTGLGLFLSSLESKNY
ncbi:uncharacterized protein LOC129914971 [Episyrphus balteatus]|uniref:uncharacterized protein LOC129914971 n=1 Tax=Episyrphus balteatus TaxID=286459 RepID=UPI00248544FC|nr:uncharacterized protein LOC129914971 [Episyrphus balteatus]